MKYYKVKPQYDNETRYKWKCGHMVRVSDGILIADELYTEREYKKLANYSGYFEEVDINKNDTYLFFGARFQK